MNAGKRYKIYQSGVGTSYRYCYDPRCRVDRPEGQGAGSDFVFVVIPDQRAPFVLRVFLADRALNVWRERQGRELDPQEQYVAAKLRLFRGFDEESRLSERW